MLNGNRILWKNKYQEKRKKNFEIEFCNFVVQFDSSLSTVRHIMFDQFYINFCGLFFKAKFFYIRASTASICSLQVRLY